MSIRSVSATPATSNSGLGPRSFGTSAVTVTEPWVRNPQWLTLPTVSAAEQKVVGLYRIDENSNFLAFNCSGNYTVDWGDGTTENFSSGVAAYHEYDYTNAAFDGTLTDDGYKQTIVTITPQAGQNLTSFSSNIIHNQSGLIAGHSTGLLDLIISLPNGTSITLATGQNIVIERYCEQVTILSYGGTSLYQLFYQKTFLKSVNISYDVTAAVTSMTQMFSNCFSLQTVPLFNTANVTSMGSTFSACNSLQTVPLFNTAKVIDMSSMFLSCFSLQTVPLFNTAKVTNMSQMFSSCDSLKAVPLFNTTNVTNMGNMFNGCRSLKTVPLFNTAKVTNMSSMFYNGTALETVPLFNTANVNTMASMFVSCDSLETVPLFNTTNVTSMATMFFSCTALETVPLFNTANVTNMYQTFAGCRSLKTVPLFNTANVTIMNDMFYSSKSLETVPLFNTANVINMSQMFVGCTSLKTVPLFNTANVTNMTNMFFSCTSLQSVPLFNTANVTLMTSMFHRCSSLQTVPAFNAGASITSSSGYTSMFGSTGTYNSPVSLSKIEATGFKYTFSVANCKLSSTALNELYTNLATVTGQTITVTGNYGVAGDDPTIATAKGWTVTG